MTWIDRIILWATRRRRLQEQVDELARRLRSVEHKVWEQP